MMEGWNLDADDNIIVFPLLGYEMATVSASSILIRLDYAKSPEELKCDTVHHFQMALTLAECRDFAKALLRAADVIETEFPRACQRPSETGRRRKLAARGSHDNRLVNPAFSGN